MFIIMHTFLILRGTTTLEAGDDGPRPYDFGALRNWELVMGKEPRLWFWPSLTNDVVLATAGGTLFKGYIGDAAYATRLQQQLLNRGRLSRGLGSTADIDNFDGELAEPADVPVDSVSDTALLLG
jgi:hypothetical protein